MTAAFQREVHSRPHLAVHQPKGHDPDPDHQTVRAHALVAHSPLLLNVAVLRRADAICTWTDALECIAAVIARRRFQHGVVGSRAERHQHACERSVRCAVNNPASDRSTAGRNRRGRLEERAHGNQNRKCHLREHGGVYLNSARAGTNRERNEAVRCLIDATNILTRPSNCQHVRIWRTRHVRSPVRTSAR
jgi:hypothetical protein